MSVRRRRATVHVGAGLLLAAACALGPAAVLVAPTPAYAAGEECEDMAASATVSEQTVEVGSGVTITGTCFPSYETATINVITPKSNGPLQLDPEPTDADGSVTWSFSADVEGDYSAVITVGQTQADVSFNAVEAEPEPTEPPTEEPDPDEPTDPAEPPVEEPEDPEDPEDPPTEGEDPESPPNPDDPTDPDDPEQTPGDGEGSDGDTGEGSNPGDGTEDGGDGTGEGTNPGDDTEGGDGSGNGDDTGSGDGSENGDDTGNGAGSGSDDEAGSGNDDSGSDDSGSDDSGQNEQTPPTKPFPGDDSGDAGQDDQDQDDPAPSAGESPSASEQKPGTPAAPGPATNDFPAATPERSADQQETAALAVLMTQLFAHGVSAGEVGTSPAEAGGADEDSSSDGENSGGDSNGGNGSNGSNGNGASDGGGDELAETGTEITAPAALAALALTGGAGLLWHHRRRED